MIANLFYFIFIFFERDIALSDTVSLRITFSFVVCKYAGLKFTSMNSKAKLTATGSKFRGLLFFVAWE